MGGERRCHVADDVMRDGGRVTLYRSVGDSIEVIAGFDEDGSPVTVRQDRAAVTDVPPLFLPREALEALAEFVKPGPSQGEVARLEEALAVERARVDQVLDRRIS